MNEEVKTLTIDLYLRDFCLILKIEQNKKYQNTFSNWKASRRYFLFDKKQTNWFQSIRVSVLKVILSTENLVDLRGLANNDLSNEVDKKWK